MKHYMHLNVEPFNLIKSGIKQVEYRLNDEKRRLIKVGDTIVFSVIENNFDIVNVVVTNLKYYKNILNMCKGTFDQYLYKYYDTSEEAAESIKYYKEEDINHYGCVAIYVKII